MDQKFLFLINREWTSPALDRLMAAVSAFEVWIVPIILLVLITLWRGGFRARAFVICAGLAVAVNDGVVAKNLKRLVDRPRPHQALSGVRIVDLAKAGFRPLALARPVKIKTSRASFKDVDGRSFPSAHAMNTCAVALLCACFYPRRGWLAFAPAGLVAYSRIYTGSHWPSDIVTSLFLSLGVTFLLLAGLEALWRNGAARFWPELHRAHPSLLGLRAPATT